MKVQQGYIFRQINKPLSYSRMRELFIEAFSPFVFNIKSYGLHSLRSGDATSAAKYGVPDRLFKRHGRWRSDKSKDCWSRLETAASPDGAIFSVSVADDPDEFCIDSSVIVTAG